MPVIDVCESWDSGSGWTHSGEPGSGVTTATRKFTVTGTADILDLDVLIDNRIPQVGAPHPWNNFVRCRGTKVKRTGPITFEAESNYELKLAIGENDSDPDNQSPLNQPAKIRVNTIKTDGQIDEDIDGMPIVTVNMERIEGITKPFSDQALVITKNLPFLAYPNLDNFYDTVNSTAFLGFGAGRLRLDTVEAEFISEGGFAYWPTTVTFISRRPINTTDERAWWKRIRHEGYRVKATNAMSTELIVNAVDANGDPVSKPVLLDVNGFEVDDPADTHWLEYQVHQAIDFNNLGLI